MIIYLLVALLSWIMIALMLFHNSQAAFIDPRSNAGIAMALGFIYAVIWPIGLPFVYCMTGFAEHGIWRQK